MEFNVVSRLQHCSLPSGLAFCPVLVTSLSETRLSTSFVLGSASAVGLLVFVAVGPNESFVALSLESSLA